MQRKATDKWSQAPCSLIDSWIADLLACEWSFIIHRVAAWAEPGQTQSMLTTDITDCAKLTLNIHTFALTVARMRVACKR